MDVYLTIFRIGHFRHWPSLASVAATKESLFDGLLFWSLLYTFSHLRCCVFLSIAISTASVFAVHVVIFACSFSLPLCHSAAVLAAVAVAVNVSVSVIVSVVISICLPPSFRLLLLSLSLALHLCLHRSPFFSFLSLSHTISSSFLLFFFISTTSSSFSSLSLSLCVLSTLTRSIGIA